MDAEFYEKDGRQYDRPTRILDYFSPPELLEWKVRTGLKEAGRISRIALKHGKRIDELIRATKEPKKGDSPEVHKCYAAWLKWVDCYCPGPLVFPETLYCEARMIAGTPDIYWPEMEDLIDVKSAKTVHENYFFQLGCYASMLPFPVKRLAVLRLDKELGEYEYVTNEQMGLSVADCVNGFNGLLIYFKLYQRAQSALKPKERVYDRKCDDITE